LKVKCIDTKHGSLSDVNFLSVNEMASLLDLVQDLGDGVVPATEAFVSELLSLGEDHDALQTVNLGLDSLVDNHVSEFGFNSVLRDAQESSDSAEADAAVVFLDDSEVVLAELLQEPVHVSLSSLSIEFEGVIGQHLLLDLVFLDRHKLKSEQFAHEGTDSLFLIQLARVGSFNNLE